jgi:hypothetical protein
MTMPIPQVNDRIKEAPAVMLRAVFAGVGQLLLAADKVRSRAAGTSWPADRTAPKGRARAQARWHTLDDTRSGTVPLAREHAHSHNYSQHTSPAKPAVQDEPAVQAAPAVVQDAPTVQDAPAVAQDEPAVPAASTVPAAPAAEAPPLTGYDDLSLPSLRARMRVFDAATLRALLAYEKAHAQRAEVIMMFERRLAKITTD